MGNDVVGEQLMATLEALGPIEYTADEVEFAKTVIEGFPRDLRASLLAKRGLPADAIDWGITGDVWPLRDKGEVGAGSTDVADVSWIAPTGCRRDGRRSRAGG